MKLILFSNFYFSINVFKMEFIINVKNSRNNQIDENIYYSLVRRKQFSTRTNSDEDNESLEIREAKPSSIITVSGSIDLFNETQSVIQKDEIIHKNEEINFRLGEGLSSIIDMTTVKCPPLQNNQLLWNLKGK